jgi:dTDP-4-amino-4,6-dideoxygalactose transaminase
MHPVKIATMGEGGIITTNDEKLAGRMSEFRSHGMTRDPKRWQSRELGFTGNQPNPWYYEMQSLGFNYRATELQCALGLSQLSKLPRFVDIRAKLVAYYDRLIAPFDSIVQPIARRGTQAPGWHLYAVRIDFATARKSRADVMRQLASAGIGTQVHYLPVHLQPYYRSLNPGLSLPGANAYYESCLSLPLHAAMSESDVERVVRTLTSALGLAGAV